jgi:hypothetical protein
MSRLHAVLVPPRVGLPLGLLLFTVYAPLSDDLEREVFNAEFIALVHSLDMHIPTIFMGDFNGSVAPHQDYDAGGKLVCPLLAELLGPAAPLFDLQRTVSPEVKAWTFVAPRKATYPSSRCDLMLGNRAALGLVQSVEVLEDIREASGHSPVILHLHLNSLAINWKQPRKQLPALLRKTSSELKQSGKWLEILEEWQGQPIVQKLVLIMQEAATSPFTKSTMQTLSSVLEAAMQALVQLAGGWQQRPSKPRMAFDTADLRQMRATLKKLCGLEARLRKLTGTGTWPYALTREVMQLQRKGVISHSSNHMELQSEVKDAIRSRQSSITLEVKRMQQERAKRWLAKIPTLWSESPGVLFRWLEGGSSAWGTTPVMSEGKQCTSLKEVDQATQQYWVTRVWQKNSGIVEEVQWEQFLSSSFASFVCVASGGIDSRKSKENLGSNEGRLCTRGTRNTHWAVEVNVKCLV